MKEIFHGDVGDERVIESAIHLGDWILQQEGLSVEEREIVRRVQDALRQYPNVVNEFVAEYGFDLFDDRYVKWENSAEAQGEFKNIDVSKIPETVIYSYCVSYFAHKEPDRRISIEIFKSIHATPLRDFIGWNENNQLYNRLVPEDEREYEIDVSTKPLKPIKDEQRQQEWILDKTKFADDLKTKARVKPQGFSIEWDISQLIFRDE